MVILSCLSGEFRNGHELNREEMARIDCVVNDCGCFRDSDGAERLVTVS